MKKEPEKAQGAHVSLVVPSFARDAQPTLTAESGNTEWLA